MKVLVVQDDLSVDEVDLDLPLEPVRRKSLTFRERDVLEGIAQGKRDKEIAADLGVSPKTVKAHVCNLLQKLGVTNRTQAAVAAIHEAALGVPSQP